VSEAGTAVPSSGLPSLRVLLLDVRPRSAFDAEHLPHAVHFHPPCLARLAQATNGSRRSAERLAQALKQAMVEVGDLVLRKDSTPTMAAEDDGLGAEVFQSLQLAASEAWGEGWLSESERAHLAILGGEEDWDSAQLCRPGAVAALFELLAEQLSMPRVSVVLGGAAVLHREAEKRGVP
ncbi:TBC1 domain family member 23, partial [Durusdinium trenchii]